MWIKREDTKLSLAEIAKLIGGKVLGDENLVIEAACSFFEPQPNSICYLKNLSKLPKADIDKSSAIIISKDSNLSNISDDFNFVLVDTPADKFIDVVKLFYERISPSPAISKPCFNFRFSKNRQRCIHRRFLLNS